MAVLTQGANRPARKYQLSRDRPVELFRRGRPTPRALSDSATMGGAEGGAERAPIPTGSAAMRSTERGAKGVVFEEGCCLEPFFLQARVSWACLTLSFFVPIPGKATTTFISSPLPIRSRILPTPHSGCLTLIPGW